MTPCEICGNSGIDNAGNCVSCGIYRGMGEGPTKARRGPGAALLFVAIGVVILLVLGGVIVVLTLRLGSRLAATGEPARPVVTSTKDEPIVEKPAASLPPQSAAELAACVVGTWSETSNVATMDAGVVLTIVTKGGRQQYLADGVYVLDYSGGVTQTQEFGGQTVSVTYDGKITANYRIEDGAATYQNAVPSGTYTMVIDGAPAGQGALRDPGLTRDALFCSGDRLTQRGTQADPITGLTADYVVELVRV